MNIVAIGIDCKYENLENLIREQQYYIDELKEEIDKIKEEIVKIQNQIENNIKNNANIENTKLDKN